MLNNAESGWVEFFEEEYLLEDYLQKFDARLTREKIEGKVKEIMVKSYMSDLANQMNNKAV